LGFQQLLDHNSIGAYGSSFPKRRRAIHNERFENRPQLLGWQRVKLMEKNDFQTTLLNIRLSGVCQEIALFSLWEIGLSSPR
jgi:hypothetical protein